MPLKPTTIIAIAIAVAGSIGVATWSQLGPRLEERSRIQASDAAKAKGKITANVDNFIGYHALCSTHLRGLMLSSEYELRCEDDDADYAGRFERLKSGEIQFAVATVDTYELKAVKTSFPGLIIAVGDESKGADGIVACTSKIKNIDDLKRGGYKVAYAGGTPSEHLLKVIATDFDVPQWRGGDKSWRVETKSSQEAAKKCVAKEVDVAVLWEPDITKTLRSNPEASKVIGTEVTHRKVVDVLMVRFEYARDNPDVVSLLLGNYFKTLLHFRSNPEDEAESAASYAKISKADAKLALAGVKFFNLRENALLWFGVEDPGLPRQFGLIETIDSTMQILIESGDFKVSQLPKGGARTIIWKDPVEKLYMSGLASADKFDPKSADSLSREFSELTEAGWKAMRQLGTIKARDIAFKSGSSDLVSSDDELLDGKKNVNRIAEAIKGYPGARIVVEGHTSNRGDPAENLELSQDRAETVARYLMVTYDVRPNRIKAVGYGGEQMGFGGKQVLPRLPGETDREYSNRLARVVVKLVTEAY